MASDDVEDLGRILRESGEHVTQEFQPPSLESILQLIDSIQDMSEEEKEEIKRDVIANAMGAAGEQIQQAVQASSYSPQLLALLVCLLLICAVFGFITYRLVQAEKGKVNKKEGKRLKRVKGKKYK